MKKSYYPIGGVFFGLILTASSINVQAQTRTISGTVTSSDKPLSGILISQEGSDQVTTTNEKGAYRLEVTAENPILLFRHPEYSEQQITVSNQSVININLEQKVKAIEEVVLNAGYYNVKAKESTGSISKVTAKDIENQPVTNVLSAVQGRMAGVNITQGGGTAGGGFDIQIRGQNSLRREGNLPLYVIDGVPLGAPVTSQYSALVLPMQSISPLNSINPDDIESIEILKDADATAIYGSRGANGVILVTTKKGRAGKMKLTLNSSLALSQALIGLKMMNTEQYLSMRKAAYAHDGIAVYPATAYDVNGRWNQNSDTDWLRTFIGNTAQTSDTQLTVSGGNKSSQFSVSAGHNTTGTVFSKDFKYTNNTFSSQFSHRSEDSRWRLNLTNLLSQQTNNVINEDITNKATLLAPNAPRLYKADGSINWENSTFTNPAAAYNATYLNENLQHITSLTTEVVIIPDLLFRFNAGLTQFRFEEWSLRPNTIYNPAVITGQSSFYSSSSTSSQSQFSYTLEPQLDWSLKRGRHEMAVLIGASIQNEKNKKEAMTGSAFESNAFLQNIAAAQTKTIVEQTQTEYRYAGFFGRINYQFAGKYILNMTGRRDGSSRFGSNNRFASFGALGAAWIFSEEKFLKDLPWLSFGKIRASLGTAGSDNIGDYQYLNTYGVSGQGYNGVAALDPSRLYNPAYSWEKTRKLETAVELGFFKDRLNITASWYRNRSSNQLVGYQLPATTGFTSVIANLPATVENTGFEMEITVRPVATENFKWESSMNLSIPRNRLLSFPGLEGSTYANKYVVGQPLSLVKLYQLEGIDPVTGLYVFTDFNGDGKISSPEDNKVAANIGVRSFGGWLNTFKWNRWDASLLLQAVKQNNYNYNTAMPLPGGFFNQPVEVLNVWSPSNPAGTYMPYSTGTAGPQNLSQNDFRNSTATVSDASYVRLKNVQISYRIPLSGKLLREAKVYVQGQNLFTWTNYFGIDPEFIVRGYLPPLKTFALGTQINF